MRKHLLLALALTAVGTGASAADVCKQNYVWEWELIEPGYIKLKGTSYSIRDRSDAPIPNLHVSGGNPYYTTPVMEGLNRAKEVAIQRVKDDCELGKKP